MDARYVAVIGDVVGSRSFRGKDRELLQRYLEGLAEVLNERFSAERVAPFEVTEGDGIKGLLHPTRRLDDLLWTADVEFSAAPLRLGIGLGTLETELRSSVSVMDGGVFHAARAAVEAARKADRLGGVFRGFTGFDEILDGIAGLLHALRLRTPQRQMQVLERLRAGSRQHHIATELTVSRQAVSEYARLAQWIYYRDGEEALRAALSAAYGAEP